MTPRSHYTHYRVRSPVTLKGTMKYTTCFMGENIKKFAKSYLPFLKEPRERIIENIKKNRGSALGDKIF